MIEANELRKGVTFELDGELFKVIDYSHNKTARGSATVRTKIRNLRTGSTTERTFNSGNRVQDVRLDHEEMEYLYQEGDLYVFMSTDTYEQTHLSKDILEDVIPYLIDNLPVKLSTYQGEPIDIEVPITIDMEVTGGEPGFAGDTATDATKAVTVSTGLEVQTPLFIDIGDTIRVDTRTG
ncbi:MAG: elongation factor P, partial [Chloroflexota bacterium]